MKVDTVLFPEKLIVSKNLSGCPKEEKPSTYSFPETPLFLRLLAYSPVVLGRGLHKGDLKELALTHTPDHSSCFGNRSRVDRESVKTD